MQSFLYLLYIYIAVVGMMGIQTMIFFVKNNPCSEKFNY